MTTHVGTVVDLVDPYFTHETKKIGGFKAASPRHPAILWMRQHPGRWALVGEGTTGLTKEMLIRLCPDLQVSEAGTMTNYAARRTYGRLPHPEGETLTKALQRGGPRGSSNPTPLPDLGRDPFNWTKAELEEACQIARDNLFPVSS